MQRQGLYPNSPRAPYVMGFECSGVIEAVGEGVTQFEASRVELQCTQMHPTLLFALSNAR